MHYIMDFYEKRRFDAIPNKKKRKKIVEQPSAVKRHCYIPTHLYTFLYNRQTMYISFSVPITK